MEIQSIIENWVESNSSLLDLGCGDGSILEKLQRKKSVRGCGLEIDSDNIKKCLEKKVDVIEQDIDRGLENFIDKSFDTVLVSQTIQVLINPRQTLEEITRIGRQCIVIIPNFGHWKSRLTVLLKGKMPVTESLPEKWYETPNIHLCTLYDFESLCENLEISINEKRIVNPKGNTGWYLSVWSNFLGSSVVYRLSKKS